MGRAIDTVLAQVTNSTPIIAATVATGDTLTVRSFNPPGQAFLEQIVSKGGQSVTTRVISPLMHDNVRGITATSAQAPMQFALPQEAGQALNSQDTLSLLGNSGGANSSVFALINYYTDLGGASARLYSWGDISGLINYIKPVSIACTASATIGQWSDTLITATENLLKANTDYAILGYQVDVACAVVAVKGPDTSNLRVGAPGTVLQDTTTDYWLEESARTGRPHIPVINAANSNATFASVADNAASTAVNVQLILAELSQNIS